MSGGGSERKPGLCIRGLRWLASLTGLPMDGIDNTALTDTLLQAVTAVSGLIAIVGRIGARDRIG